MAKTLRVTVVGCGRIAQGVHLGVLVSCPGVEVAALADPDPVRLREAHRRVPTAAAFDNYREALDGDDVQAAVIATSTASHAEVAIAALRLGKHVYLEKPIASDLAGAREVLSAWRESGAVGMIGFNYRFHPLYKSLARELHSGRVGDVVAVRSVFSTTVVGHSEWKRSRALGGGVLLDLASHHIDLIPFLFERQVVEVSAKLRSRRGEGDTATLELRLDDGVLVQSFFSLDSVEEDRLEVYGQMGKLTVDRCSGLAVRFEDAQRREGRLGSLRRWLRSQGSLGRLVRKLRFSDHEPSYRAALAHFVDAVRAGRAARPDLSDGYRSLEIIEAAERSAATGISVKLGSLDVADLSRRDLAAREGRP